MFPEIITINDVLPYIEGNDNFLHIQKENYSVIDYVGVGGAVFPGPENPNYKIFRECRGLIFNEYGLLLSRPLTKAFNYGEKPEEDKLLNWSASVITHKLDGSMIRPIEVTGYEGWKLATRKGITDVALQAEAYLERSGRQKDYFNFFTACWTAQYTPIFEFTSRENRIVLDYPKDALTLLAIRHLQTGEYLDRNSLVVNACRYGIPVVDIFHSGEFKDPLDFVQKVRELKNLEGVVVFFTDTQQMVKIKAEDYCNLHRVKSYIDNERSVIACLVNDQLDDLIPLLSPGQLIKVEAYVDAFWSGFHKSRAELHDLIFAARPFAQDKRTFAVDFVQKQAKEWQPILYALHKSGKLITLDVHELNETLKSFIKYHNQDAVNNTRWIHGAKW